MKANAATHKAVADAIIRSPEFEKMFDRISENLTETIKDVSHVGLALAGLAAQGRLVANDTEAGALLVHAGQLVHGQKYAPATWDSAGRELAAGAIIDAGDSGSMAAASTAAASLLANFADGNADELRVGLVGFIDHLLNGISVNPDPESDAAATGATVALEALVSIHEGRPAKDVAADHAAALLDDFEGSSRAENLAELTAFIENTIGNRVTSVTPS